MELLNLMVKYYINTAKRAFKLSIKNWPAMFALLAYSAVLSAVGILAARIFFIGGIIMAIVTAACMGSYLYLVQSIINYRLVNMNDFKNSFTPYLGRVMNVTFYIWIASLVYSLLVENILMQLPSGWIINLLIMLAVFIMLNPLPEMIYQTYHSELNIFRACVEFMQENFLEWVIPNAILLGLIYYLIGGSILSTVLSFDIAGMIKSIVGLFIFLFAMIFRGILFRFLNESTRRSRLFKLRMLM